MHVCTPRYYGAETREKGISIRRDGEKLLVERAEVESEESKILTHLRAAQRSFEEQKEAERVVREHAAHLRAFACVRDVHSPTILSVCCCD